MLDFFLYYLFLLMDISFYLYHKFKDNNNLCINSMPVWFIKLFLRSGGPWLWMKKPQICNLICPMHPQVLFFERAIPMATTFAKCKKPFLKAFYCFLLAHDSDNKAGQIKFICPLSLSYCLSSSLSFSVSIIFKLLITFVSFFFFLNFKGIIANYLSGNHCQCVLFSNLM